MSYIYKVKSTTSFTGPKEFKAVLPPEAETGIYKVAVAIGENSVKVKPQGFDLKIGIVPYSSGQIEGSSIVNNLNNSTSCFTKTSEGVIQHVPFQIIDFVTTLVFPANTTPLNIGCYVNHVKYNEGEESPTSITVSLPDKPSGRNPIINVIFIPIQMYNNVANNS